MRSVSIENARHLRSRHEFMPLHVQLLPTSLGDHSQNQSLTTFLVNDTIAIDAGSLGFALTVDQLKSRFGFVRTLSEARPYDQLCYTQGGAIGEAGVRADGKEVRFLRNSD